MASTASSLRSAMHLRSSCPPGCHPPHMPSFAGSGSQFNRSPISRRLSRASMSRSTVRLSPSRQHSRASLHSSRSLELSTFLRLQAATVTLTTLSMGRSTSPALPWPRMTMVECHYQDAHPPQPCRRLRHLYHLGHRHPHSHLRCPRRHHRRHSPRHCRLHHHRPRHRHRHPRHRRRRHCRHFRRVSSP